jgi:hypothetical protein
MPRPFRGTRLALAQQQAVTEPAGLPALTDGLLMYAPFQGDKRAHIKGGATVFTDPSAEVVDSDGMYESPYAPDYFYVGATTNEARVRRNGLMSERVTTNSGLHSQDLSNAVWTLPSNGTKGSNVTTAPDGTATGDAIVEDATAPGTFEVAQTQTITAARASVISIFAKAGTRGFLRIGMPTLTIPLAVDFNLTTGAVCAQAGEDDCGVIDDRNDGWRRYWVVYTATSDAGTHDVTFTASDTCGGTSYNGVNGAEAVYLWQYDFADNQLAVSSPIPTTTLAVTRASDEISFANVELTSGNPFSIFGVLDVPYSVNPGTDRYFYYNQADASNFINMLIFRTTGVISTSMTVGGVSQFAKLGTDPVVGGRNTLCLCVDTNDMRLYRNASEQATDTTVTLPTSFGAHEMGWNSVSADRNLGSPMSYFQIYDHALTAEEVTLLDGQYR